jgi:hypothetical protein
MRTGVVPDTHGYESTTRPGSVIWREIIKKLAQDSHRLRSPGKISKISISRHQSDECEGTKGGRRVDFLQLILRCR